MTTGSWQREADRLAQAAVAAGDATGWFEQLWSKGRAGEIPVPWDTGQAHPLLAEWIGAREAAGPAQRAVVVGCGLGADAELVATRGFDTVAFDVSPSAIELARERHPDSPVKYEQADLFELNEQWHQAFGLVVDVYTVQALPVSLRHQATAAVADLVAPSGTLLLLMSAQDDDTDSQGPPWPLSRRDIDAFGSQGLTPVKVERLPFRTMTSSHWRAEFTRILR
jgi:SAM-dependent methyltransferase